LPALLDRLDQESSAMVSQALGAALAAVGNSVLPSLLERLQRGDIRNFRAMAMTFSLLGETAAIEIVKVLFSDPDIAIRGLGVAMVREMGSKAGPAVPAMAAMLDGADDEFACYLMTTILGCGTAAQQATPAVIRCLEDGDEELAWVALRFLRNLGPCVVPDLKAAAEQATGDARERILRGLREIDGTGQDRFAHLRELGKDHWLITFAAVGTMLEREGPLGFDAMEELVAGGYDLEFKPDRFRSSTLRTNVNNLAKKLGEPVISQEHGKRSRLTEFGGNLLADVKEYLRSKAG
jgi:hypothetical protein